MLPLFPVLAGLICGAHAQTLRLRVLTPVAAPIAAPAPILTPGPALLSPYLVLPLPAAVSPVMPLIAGPAAAAKRAEAFLPLRAVAGAVRPSRSGRRAAALSRFFDAGRGGSPVDLPGGARDLALPGHRLWDNWGYYDQRERVYHRFALASDAALPIESKDDAPHIRRFISRDGDSWEDAGVFLAPGFSPEAGGVWSGSSFRDSASGEWSLYFTARRPGPRARQSLWVVPVLPGGGPGIPRKIADAEDPVFRARAEDLGYHLDEGDGVVSALRDPYREGDIVYFAAKSGRDRSIRPAVGRARVGGGRFELLAPLSPPLGRFWSQIELPQIVTVRGRRLLMATVSNGGHRGDEPGGTRTGLVFFRFARDGSIEPPRKGDRLAGVHLPRRTGLYSANQLRGAAGGRVFLTFRSHGAGRRSFTLPPPMTLKELLGL